MSDNKNLRKANKRKQDEFYTQLIDIELELKHYKDFFRGNVILCNCDDPYESNFFKYFAMNFNHLGLKKLIATCYDTSPVSYTQLSFFGVNENITYPNKNRRAYRIEINEVPDMNNDGAIDLSDVKLLLQNKKNTLVHLNGDGDFRSDECIEFLKQADIVVTNPPFSLFREYVAQLFEYDKKFIIIGNQNAIGYREIFPYIRDNKLFLGLSMNGSNRYFQVPNDYPLTEKTCKVVDGKKFAFVKSVVWFTNFDINNVREPICLYKRYSQNEYRKYENFDAINVDKVTDIPMDYDGFIGVPITFLHKYNPNQFEIIGLGISNSGLEIGVKPYLFEHKKYRKEIQHRGAVDGDLYFVDKNGHIDVPYSRILIRRKNYEN